MAARPLGRRLAPTGSDGTDELYLVLVAAMCLLVGRRVVQLMDAPVPEGLLLSGAVGLVGLLVSGKTRAL